MESVQHLSERLNSFWRLRRLEIVANYVVEASVSTIILFCVKSAKMLMTYINGRRFSTQAFIRARFLMKITTLRSYTGPFHQRGPHRDWFISHDYRQMLEGGCHLQEDQREQMDKDIEHLLAIRDDIKNRRSVVRLLDSPFPAEQSQAHN